MMYEIEKELLQELSGVELTLYDGFDHVICFDNSFARSIFAIGALSSDASNELDMKLYAGPKRGLECKKGWVVLACEPYRIHSWPPMEFAELIRKMQDDGFRKKYGFPPLREADVV